MDSKSGLAIMLHQTNTQLVNHDQLQIKANNSNQQKKILCKISLK